jgi:arginine decarboxylase
MTVQPPAVPLRRSNSADHRAASQHAAPIFECVRDYLDRFNTLFSSPGHNGGRTLPKEFARRVAEFDATLQAEPKKFGSADGPLRIAEQLLAEAYGVDRSFMLVGGSTAGNIASLVALVAPGECVLVPRNVHKSVVAGLVHTGAVPVWMQPDWDPRFRIAHGVGIAEIKEALRRNKSARALLCLGATYFGTTPDMSAIARLAEAQRLALLVDAAHGPHFRFHSQLPAAAENLGAATVVQSIHKILPGLSAAAVLHIRTDIVNEYRMRQALQLVETTSPNIATLASIDLARRQMALKGQLLLDRVLLLARQARDALIDIPGVLVLDQHHSLGPDSGFRQLDALKLTVNLCAFQVPDRAIWDHFLGHHGIQPEFVESGNVLCQFTLGTTAADVERLIAAIRQFARMQPPHRDGSIRSTSELAERTLREIPIVELTPREAFYAPARETELESAIGAISADIVTPYPPGVPVLMPGERITAEIVEFLKNLRAVRHRMSAADSSLAYLRIVR